MGDSEAIVIGAGFAGLGTSRELRRRGVDARVLEARDRVAEPWRSRYDSLHLNTIGWQSAAPGRRFPKGTGPYPSRDDVVAYLETYARDLPIEYGVEALRVERNDDGWRVRTTEGEREARAVIIAAGFDREPLLPDWPGREGFEGELIHASAYRNADPYRGKDMLVVSAGNTGSEISLELRRNGAASVRTSRRSSPNIAKRWVGRLPGAYFATGISALPIPVIDQLTWVNQRVNFGDLSEYGLPKPTYGMGTNVFERAVAPVIDNGFVDAVKAGQIEIVAAVESFDGPEVVLADGRRLRPDVVIAATGYRRALDALVGHLGVLEPNGHPSHNGPDSPPNAPGIWFTGYETLIRGQLALARRHAKRIGREAARWIAARR